MYIATVMVERAVINYLLHTSCKLWLVMGAMRGGGGGGLASDRETIVLGVGTCEFETLVLHNAYTTFQHDS